MLYMEHVLCPYAVLNLLLFFFSTCFQVCREYQRGNCSRGENDCRFAHPADSTMIDTNDNTVTVCMDYIKGRCSREKCKYFHPPAHLQAKIKAAQHQVNQATAAAAMVSSLYEHGHIHSHPHDRLRSNFEEAIYYEFFHAVGNAHGRSKP